MNRTEISITWDAYLNNVSKGFSSLQQNSEFVDMTLAAEGHLVKVHQNIVALASPYLRAMLQSAPCQHPVIFLNNVNHKILGYILEYIYTGEVKIPSDIIDTFIEACKSLWIRGVDSIASSKTTSEDQSQPQIEKAEHPSDTNFAAHITINNKDNNYDLEFIPNENNVVSHNDEELPPPILDPTFSNNTDEMESEICSSLLNDHDTERENEIDISSIHNFVILKPKTSSNQIDFSSKSKKNVIKILSDETIVAKDFETKSNNLINKSNQDLKESTINRAIDTNAWHFDSSQNPSSIELGANPILHPVNITLSTNDLPSKFTQSISEVHTDSIEPIIPKKANKRTITKKPKNVLSYIRNIKRMEDRPNISLNKLSRIEMDKVAHYTISNRGSLQLLLCRYMYYSHHHSNGGRKIRWRCIDYRKMHCPAYIDTDNENIIAVSQNHCHPNHDNQIRKKIKSNIIFTSLSQAVHSVEAYLKENPKK